SFDKLHFSGHVNSLCVIGRRHLYDNRRKAMINDNDVVCKWIFPVIGREKPGSLCSADKCAHVEINAGAFSYDRAGKLPRLPVGLITCMARHLFGDVNVTNLGLGLGLGLVLLFLLLVFISVFSLFFVSHFSLLFKNKRG
ncbi:MAG: hypothetical protein WA821_11400, partial [Anaerolineales bacterium]